MFVAGREARVKRTKDAVERDLEDLVDALKNPRTVTELAERFDVTDRTIYTWITALEARVYCGPVGY